MVFIRLHGYWPTFSACDWHIDATKEHGVMLSCEPLLSRPVFLAIDDAEALHKALGHAIEQAKSCTGDGS